ncbi:pre-mRNA-processing factor 6 [Metschnikowia aff. pulcherrima]|uniref:Pre-mRNA-processing factor 6 n=1 Tax=Metschnikowia aff. pulcherrima TaxID=2163413 RepID=A0A4P6XNP5_9ASCO|nr:pre-mRNA-processing factor 6 [Metschnikowia aff. pulcherrima]
MERKSFLDQDPPPGYVAGVGRGATGFTTSADTGPVRFESQFGGELADGADAQEEGILAQTANKSREDDEADRIYEQIDHRLQKRYKKRSGDQVSADSAGTVEIPTGTGAIQQEFTLLKSELAQVSMDEWASLPEVGDLTRRNKRQRLLDQQQQRTYAAPDMLISSAGSGFKENASNTTVAAENDSAVKLAEIEEWEQKSALAGDLEKGRLVLASLRRAEPYKADLWISSARLEEQARQIHQAKILISKGCDLIPHNDAIWLESIRLHRSEGTKVCKTIMSEALRLNSQSEKLWFAALQLENPGDVTSRRKVVMKALEFLPRSVNLWKFLIDMGGTNEEQMRLLTRATELCPKEWDLWLTLVNISSYSDAKAVLNKARKQLPNEANIWITALKLEERENLDVSVEKLAIMFEKGRKELARHSFTKSAAKWLEDAVKAQEEGFAKSSQAIVKCVLKDISVGDELDQLHALAASHSLTSPMISSYIQQFICEVQPLVINNWRMLFGLLKSDIPRLYDMYEKAMESMPENEIVPLMYAKDKWILGSDVPGARAILENACKVMPNSEKIWVGRLKLELRNHEFTRALTVSKDSIRVPSTSSPRLWYKHIHVLRYHCKRKPGQIAIENALAASKEALLLFPENPKLYLQQAQIFIDSDDTLAARECLSTGTKFCPACPILWRSLAFLDLDNSAIARARSVLDVAVSRYKDEPMLWEAKIELEFRLNDLVTARQLINKALKNFPSRPRIWILHLKNIPKMAHRKNAFLDALKQTNNSTEVLLAIGVFFWLDGKFLKAKAWFDRALNAHDGNGDAWGWMFNFQTRYGKEEDVNVLLQNFGKSFDDIRKGDVWCRVVKAPQNLDKTPAELLELVSDELTLSDA